MEVINFVVYSSDQTIDVSYVIIATDKNGNFLMYDFVFGL